MLKLLFGWRGLAVLALLLTVQTARLSMSDHALKGARAKVEKAIADWSAMHDAIVNPKTGWRVAYSRLEAARRADATQAARSIDTASSERVAASSNAFDQGYAAGRTAGRKSCGVSNATIPPTPGGSAGSGARPDPGRLSRPAPGDDLAVLWRDGAYRPR